MKNFKKVLFGGLVSLMMVTGVSAVVDNDTYYEDNNIKTASALKTCFEQNKEDHVTCTLATNINNMENNLVSASKNVTLNLNNHKITFTATYGIKASVKNSVTINGGTIEFTNGWINEFGDLTINNTTLTSEGTTGALIVVGDATATAGKLNVTLNNVTATSETGSVVEVVAATAIPVVLNMSGTYTTSAASKNIIDVKVTGKADITLAGTYTSENSIYAETVAAKTLKVNAGTYTAKDDAFALAGAKTTVDGATIVSGGKGLVTSAATEIEVVNATITADENAIDAEQSGDKVTVKNGAMNAKGDVIIVKNADLTIDNGTFTSTNKGVVVNATTAGNLVINNGTFTTEGDYAAKLEDLTSTKIVNGAFKAAGTVVYTNHIPSFITGGTYEGNNKDDVTKANLATKAAEDYTAVRIGDVVYVGKAHTLYIEIADRTNGTVTKADNSVAGMLENHTYKFEDIKDYLKVKANEGYAVKYVLVYGEDDEKTGVVTAEGFTMPDEDAKLIVSFVPASEVVVPGENQGSTTEPGKDNEPSNNPNTFDGIASFVTLAISSLGAAGYSIKKVIKR